MTKLRLSLFLALVFVISVVFGQAQDLYVASLNSNQVLAYGGSTGSSLGVFASGGGLNGPARVTFGPDGHLYVSSYYSSEVLKYDGSTGAFIAAFVPAGSGGLSFPVGFVFGPDGNLYVCSAATSEVLKYDGSTGAFIGAFVTAGSGGLFGPSNLTFGPDHNLYVTSSSTNEVLKYDGTTGAFITTFVSAGSGGVIDPQGVVFSPWDSNFYVTSQDNGAVLKYNGITGAFISAFVTAGSGGLSLAGDLVFGPDGNLYVCSYGTSEILKYNGNTGAFVSALVSAGSGGLQGPEGLAFSPAPKALTSVGPATVWVGLKNSDDQGTQFDIGVDIYKNAALVSSGITLCVTGITRNPANSSMVTVSLSSPGNVPVQTGDTLTFKVKTRIGTNPNGSKCSGPGGSHSNAVGLRLYYDAPGAPSRFAARISPDPSVDFYLHSSGSVLSFDTNTPITGTAKTKDSAGVNFASGNPWKEIGAWSRQQP